MRTLFAVEDWFVGVAAGVGGLIVAAVAAAIKLLTWFAKRNDEARKTSNDEWTEIVARQDLRILHIEHLESVCRSRERETRDNVIYLHGFVCRLAEQLRAGGVTVEQVKPLNDYLPDHRMEDEEQQRQSKQASVLIHAEAKAVGAVKPPEAKP